MEYSGKQRFQGVDHDSKMCLLKTHLPWETTRTQQKQLERKWTNEEGKTGVGLQSATAKGGTDNYHVVGAICIEM